jgi:uracil-DNA glycosylase family protein
MTARRGAADERASIEPAPAPAEHPATRPEVRHDLEAAREAVDACRACDLWARATQGVFGEGHPGAPLMLVGEQPGDREDLAGRPFVGPAGRLLDEALAEAGIDRERAFVTNVVKHFKWRPSGKRRLHEKPDREEVRACRPWLDLEVELVRPEILVLLGATAAQAVLGPGFKVTVDHGRLLEPDRPGGPRSLGTYHPSSVLRARSSEERERLRGILVADLTVAARALPSPPGRAGRSG